MRKIQFITGPAGTGKSTRLRQLIEEETRPSLITAPTGIAAVNIGGATMHRTFKIDSQTNLVRNRWPAIEVVYVDEVSMMGSRLFDALIVGAPEAEFIFVGDMAQLPPVKDKFWFESENINLFDVNIHKLTENFRQSGDLTFQSTLNKIREGRATKTDMRWLWNFSTLEEENPAATVLAYRNDTVRALNAERLLQLDGEMTELEAVYTGFMKDGDCRAETVLHLKVGAEIIFVVNDKEGRYQNGTRGVVTLINKNANWMEVQVKDERILVVPHTWQMRVPSKIDDHRRKELEHKLVRTKLFTDQILEIEHWLRTGIEYVVVGSCEQFPVKLAYAMTVHKSQGLTLVSTNIIMSGFAGSHGIGYVALSRVSSIDDITFSKAPQLGDFKFNNKLKDYV